MQRQKEQLTILAFSAVIVAIGFYLIQPLWDMDFWWHIASGKWIVGSWTIPDTDPFGVFSDSDPIRLKTLLRAEWLGQVFLFLCYNSFGVNGIVALRVIILLLCLGLVFKRAGRLQASPLVTLLYIGLAGIILTGFTGSRPQLFSFFFASLTFLIVDAYNRSGRRWFLLILPFISILWSNCHGGGILGSVLLIMYCTFRSLESLVRNKALDKSSSDLLVAGALFFAGTLVTPNGIITYQYLVHLEGSQLQRITSEYTSSFKLHTLGLVYRQIWVGLVFAATLGGIAGLLRENKAEMIVTVFLALISFMYYRYVPFLILVSGPYICLGLSNILCKTKAGHRLMNARAYFIATLGIAFVALALMVIGTMQGCSFRGGINQHNFPVKAVEYIRTNNISGKAFNHFKWGGYLTWFLYPEVKIFIDGRMLDGNRLPPYTHILWATPQGIRFFEDQEFDLVILPWKTYYSGEVYTLHEYLQKQQSWNLIFFDRENGHLIYKRRKEMNSQTTGIDHAGR